MMKILAIDTSGMPASVAVCTEETLLAEYTVHLKRTHSQTLMPMMEEIRRTLELDLNTVDAIAVAGGPGSFTGLRIGSAAAKGIGLALDKPLVHVPTLEAMAYNFYGTESLVAPMMDARRNQVFAGIYTYKRMGMPPAQMESAQMEPAQMDLSQESLAQGHAALASPAYVDPLTILSDQEPLEIGDLCSRLNTLSLETGKQVILSGDGAQAYRAVIEGCLKVPHFYAPAHLALQKAGAVAARALDLARMGKLESAAQHRPDYLRVSQAERVRAQKEQGTHAG